MSNRRPTSRSKRPYASPRTRTPCPRSCAATAFRQSISAPPAGRLARGRTPRLPTTVADESPVTGSPTPQLVHGWTPQRRNDGCTASTHDDRTHHDGARSHRVRGVPRHCTQRADGRRRGPAALAPAIAVPPTALRTQATGPFRAATGHDRNASDRLQEGARAGATH